MGTYAIYRNFFALIVHKPEVVLSHRIPLSGGKPEPRQSFFVILSHSVTVRIHSTDISLSWCITLSGS
jgi:hypothetical protein